MVCVAPAALTTVDGRPGGAYPLSYAATEVPSVYVVTAPTESSRVPSRNTS